MPAAAIGVDETILLPPSRGYAILYRGHNAVPKVKAVTSPVGLCIPPNHKVVQTHGLQNTTHTL